MPILVLQHTASETLGRLGTCLRDHGQQLDVRHLYRPESISNPHLPRDLDDVHGVISLGGTMNVGDNLVWMQPELALLKAAHERRLPLIGICLGAQMIAKALGGEVGPMDNSPEWGMLPIRQNPAGNTETLLAGVSWTTPQFHCHGQEVKAPPTGATIFQYSDKCKMQSFRVGLRTYGFQYHFECEMGMIESFLRSGDPQIAQSGITNVENAIESAKLQYNEYARVSDRLCVNLAEYLLPVTRELVA